MGKYTVYKHTAPNGKVYIGITGKKPSTRWANGNGYQLQPVFHRAIMKYGWDNIEHEILAEGLEQVEAERMEIELIEEYKSTDRRYGYNVLLGGDLKRVGSCKFKGDIIDEHFLCLGSEDGKLLLECLECGRVLKRFPAVTTQSSHIKCECMKKTKPPQRPRHYHLIEIDGEVHTVSEWSRIFNIPPETIRYRETHGLDIVEGKQPTLTPCPICGQGFHKNKPKQKYCSKVCQSKAQCKERPTATCQICGKTFTVGRESKGMYCSRNCQHASMRKG